MVRDTSVHRVYTLTHSFARPLRIDITQLSLNTLLGPFFALIRSPLSTGPITSTALAALHSFFVCGLINAKSIDLDVTLTEFSSAVSHCKFEASDSSGDELVMLRIMTLVQDCMCHKDIGQRLGDIEVCEMLETVLTTACQMRLTGMLPSAILIRTHIDISQWPLDVFQNQPCTPWCALCSQDSTPWIQK